MSALYTAAQIDELENVFSAKYGWLLRWALHFAQGDYMAAEDMVQDTFARFFLAGPDLNEVANIEALLYTYLKYVHLDRLRKLQHYPSEPISLADYDSLRIGLRDNAASEQASVQETLQRIATYLNWRKATSKSASMLILRYFHGYYPEEIMHVALLKRRNAVETALCEAREEVKQYIDSPDRYCETHAAHPPEDAPAHAAMSSDLFIQQLQTQIFSASSSECLSEERLIGLYRAAIQEPIDRGLLAHLVSCKRCLRLVSNFLRMTPPSERDPEESLGQDKNARQRAKAMNNFSVSDQQMQSSLDAVWERVREAYEHYPQRLIVVVNGSEVACQDVGMTKNRLNIKLNGDQKPELVEIFSEQGLCLLTAHVEAVPPSAPPEVRRSSQLSYGRQLETCLHFTSVGVYLEISYQDCSLEDSTGSAAASSVSEGVVRQSAVLNSAKRFRAAWLSRLSSLFSKAFVPRLVLSVGGVLAVVAVCALSYLQLYRREPELNAKEILIHAESASREGAEGVGPGVVSQIVEIRAAGVTLQRKIYRDVQRRRMLKPAKSTTQEIRLQNLFTEAGLDWDEPLSAGGFLAWCDHQDGARESVRRAGGSLLVLAEEEHDGLVRRETLTLRQSDLHPTKRTVEMRDGERLEIAEIDYRVEPWTEPIERLFTPPAPACNCNQSLVEELPDSFRQAAALGDALRERFEPASAQPFLHAQAAIGAHRMGGMSSNAFALRERLRRSG